MEAHVSNQQLKVAYHPLDALILNEANPRLHSRRQIRQIARSIETFGFLVPVLVDRDLKVIAGHGRVLASRELKAAEVPTISVDHLSREQVRAYMITDNKLTENSTWSEELLAHHFIELSALDLNFDLDVTGFEIGEIDFLIENQGRPRKIRPMTFTTFLWGRLPANQATFGCWDAIACCVAIRWNHRHTPR
jgi:ParB-like chromosome segregation protein Spo0J